MTPGFTDRQMDKRISEGLLIAGITLLGYITAFCNDASFAGYYGIPFYLVSVTLIQVLIALLSILVLFV